MTKTIMVQGTTSDAGKSVLVAGLCRVLHRRGAAVAPFKPQNMALNSAVTADGGEIGRAQALQAQACGLEPHTDMNPILLKPSSDTGAQVIVHGKALSNMEAQNYHNYKKRAMDAVLESHGRLAEHYECIVVEGAGSPAEINLRENDIANMGFAEAVDCPVIIVADIDRGGVFAHLVGTLDLLSAPEQNRVIGFVINRFRGDIALLASGLDWLEQKTGKPVLGVVPYLQGLYLDAEDAINSQQVELASGQKLSVVVPVLSRISNHTDFDVLRLHPQVDLSFVSVDSEPPPCDLLIFPGSKNVCADMTLLKKHGWEAVISKHLRYGGKLMGICGGYQMLGQRIEDNEGIEGNPCKVAGLGLFDMTTVLQKEKQLKRVTGQFVNGNGARQQLEGYEIHCGTSQWGSRAQPFAQLSDGQVEGAISDDSQVLGTYLHGVFDHPDACHGLLQWAGLANPEHQDVREIREAQLERLADTLESSLDLSFLEAG